MSGLSPPPSPPVCPWLSISPPCPQLTRPAPLSPLLGPLRPIAVILNLSLFLAENCAHRGDGNDAARLYFRAHFRVYQFEAILFLLDSVHRVQMQIGNCRCLGIWFNYSTRNRENWEFFLVEKFGGNCSKLYMVGQDVWTTCYVMKQGKGENELLKGKDLSCI